MRFVILCVLFGLLAIPTTTEAADKGLQRHRLGEYCPHCAAPCYATVSKGTVEKYCFEVETRAICIPRVTFPWQLCGGRCGGAGCDRKGCTAKSDCGCAGKGKACGGKGRCPEVNCVEPAQCGRVRHVNVLLKRTYECPSCKYTWTVDGDKSKDLPVKAEPPAPAAPITAARRRLSDVQPIRVDSVNQTLPIPLRVARPSIRD